MMKKKKPSAVRLDKSKIAAPDEGHTTVCHVRPTEDTCYTVGDVFVSDHPSNKPSTSFDDEAAADAGRNSNMGPKNSTISPYSSSPIAIVVGPGLATYWVPKHLLRSPKWSTTEAGGTICLPEASVATGHTLVHYLYTGTYQALEATGADLASLSYNKFKQGLLVYILASTYELPNLERLAREQIQILGGFMTLVEVLNTVKKECSNLAQCWFHEYLQERVKEQFDLDYTFFTSEAFFESIGKCALHEFMTSLLLGVFSDKLTHTLQRRQSRCQSKETFGTTLGNVEDEDGQTCHCLSFCDGHGTNMCTSSCEISLDLPTESREEDVDGVVSLETSSLPDFAIPGIAMEQPPPLGIPENFEDQGVVQSEPIQLWEEPYESIRAIEEEQREDTVSLPVSEVLPREEMVPPPQPDPMSSEPNRNEENERRSVTFRDTNQDEEKIMMIPEEPIPEPAADQEPCPEPEQEHKPEIWPQEPTPDASSTLCPRRSQHLWKSNRWRSCERCQAMLREIAVQLATENKTALLPE